MEPVTSLENFQTDYLLQQEYPILYMQSWYFMHNSCRYLLLYVATSLYTI